VAITFGLSRLVTRTGQNDFITRRQITIEVHRRHYDWTRILKNHRKRYIRVWARLCERVCACEARAY